ncbi:MAG: hypothetical protein HYX63_03970 [Gammaproteobacteria bacterium]|nr:hypothetical protein [Gammaproteobacteria bacterium]
MTQTILIGIDLGTTNSAVAVKEALQKAELPAAQGGAAIFDGCKPLKMKGSKNHTFCFPYSE